MAEKEDAWIERMRRFLFEETPEETEDPLKAAAEVVRFVSNGGAWDDYPFAGNELPDMRRTVDALDLSVSRVDYLGWFEGNIKDLINARERTTRCKRCSDHVDIWWSGNEAFEREVARLILEAHGGNADVAVYAVSPELFESDCVLPYFDVGVETRVIRHIRELAM